MTSEPPKKNSQQFTAKQKKAIARAYLLGSRLLAGMLTKFDMLLEDGRVAVENVHHARFVCMSVLMWAQAMVGAVGLRYDIKLTVFWYGVDDNVWQNENGVEFCLEFPDEFSEVIVEINLARRGDRLLRFTGHMDNDNISNAEYADIMRNIVTAEGCNETRHARENKDASSDGAD